MQSRHQHHSFKLFQINAKWTADEPVQGWRHFRIAAIRKDEANEKLVELMAVCDRQVRFWLPMQDLKKNANWRAGWV